MSGFAFENTKNVLSRFGMIVEGGEDNITQEDKDFIKFFPYKLSEALIKEYGLENALKVAKCIEILE